MSSLANLDLTAWHSKPEPNCINRSLQDYLPAEMWQPICNILQSVRVVAACRYPKGFLQYRNADGTFCYEDFVRVLPDASQVASSCDLFSFTTCSTACQNALNTYVTNSGCCINVLNNTVFSASGSTLNTLSNNLWSRCGVDTPGFCNVETSSLSSAEAPYFVKALMMLTLVVMAMLLL